MLFNKFQNRTIIKGTLEAVDPIHIGASEKNSLNPTEIDSPVLKDHFGNPVIPGSSIKGVVRSYFESVMRSLYPNDIKKACNVLEDTQCCISNKDYETFKNNCKDVAKLSNEIYHESCEVCRLFGGKAIAGKIQFKDCMFKGDKPIYEHRDGVAIDRDTGTAKNKAKYDFEVVAKGTQFDFFMIAENLDEAQQNQLNFIIKLLEGNSVIDGDYISIGGKTTRGMGRVKLIDCTKTTVTANDLKQKFSL